MIASQLRYTITILKKQSVVSEYGSSEDTYVEDYTTKAGITYNSGGESISNDQIEPTQKLTFLIRKRKDKEINETYRIRYNNNDYNINEIIKKYDGSFKSLELKTTRIEK